MMTAPAAAHSLHTLTTHQPTQSCSKVLPAQRDARRRPAQQPARRHGHGRRRGARQGDGCVCDVFFCVFLCVLMRVCAARGGGGQTFINKPHAHDTQQQHQKTKQQQKKAARCASRCWRASWCRATTRTTPTTARRSCTRVRGRGREGGRRGCGCGAQKRGGQRRHWRRGRPLSKLSKHKPS